MTQFALNRIVQSVCILRWLAVQLKINYAGVEFGPSPTKEFHVMSEHYCDIDSKIVDNFLDNSNLENI